MKSDMSTMFLNFLHKWLFPDFTNKLTWAVASTGILIVTTPVEFKVAICNWLISTLNASSVPQFEVPLVEENQNVMGYVLIFFSLAHNAVYKIISYKLDALSFEIKRDKRRVDLDLYEKFVELFPSAGETVLMLKDGDFACDVSKASMKALNEFMNLWEGAEFTFNNEDIESRKSEFYNLVTNFKRKVSLYTVSKDSDYLTVYPRDIDPEFDSVPQSVKNDIETLDALANELYIKHQSFITYCKKNL